MILLSSCSDLRTCLSVFEMFGFGSLVFSSAYLTFHLCLLAHALDISSDKLARFHTGRYGYGQEKGNLKRKKKESVLIVEQNNAIRSTYAKAKIDATDE